MSTKRVLASTTPFTNNFCKSVTHSRKNYLFLRASLPLALCNILVLEDTLNAWPPATPFYEPRDPYHTCGKLSLLFSLQVSSFFSHSLSQSNPYLCLLLLLLLDTFPSLLYIPFDMKGPELHRWTETVNLCHVKATFAVLSSISSLIIPNDWFMYLTTTEHWTSASQWPSRIPQSALSLMIWIISSASFLTSLPTLTMNIFRVWGGSHNPEKLRGTVSEQGDRVSCWITCELLTGYPLPYLLLAIVSTRQSILTTDIHQWDLFQIAPISSLIKLLQSATVIKLTVTNMCYQLQIKLAGCWTPSSEKEGQTPQSHAGTLSNLFVL